MGKDGSGCIQGKSISMNKSWGFHWSQRVDERLLSKSMWNRGMFSKACTDIQEGKKGGRKLEAKWRDAAAVQSVEREANKVGHTVRLLHLHKIFNSWSEKVWQRLLLLQRREQKSCSDRLANYYSWGFFIYECCSLSFNCSYAIIVMNLFICLFLFHVSILSLILHTKKKKVPIKHRFYHHV